MKLYSFITLFIFITDRLVKEIVNCFKFSLTSEYILIPNIITIKYTENHGISFGFLSDSFVGTIILPLILVLILCFIIIKLNNNISNVAFSLILAGFLGNFYDRVFFGFIIDMIYLPFLPFFVCNIADISIFFGVAILAYSYLKKEKLINE